MAYIKAIFREEDDSVAGALAEHKKKVREILERVMDEPPGSLVLFPATISKHASFVIENMSRFELEVYNGDNRPTIWDEERGNVQAEEVAQTLAGACPSLSKFTFGLWIRSAQVWGRARYLPPHARH